MPLHCWWSVLLIALKFMLMTQMDMLIKLLGKKIYWLTNTKEMNKLSPENLKLSKNKSLLHQKYWLKKSQLNQKSLTNLSNFQSDKKSLLNQPFWIRISKLFLNLCMDKIWLSIEDLFSFHLNRVMRKLRRKSIFQETMLITTLIYNHKNIPFIKKLMWLIPKSLKKNYNQFSKELNKNLKLYKEMLMFQEPTSTINLFFNQLLIERTSNWTLSMVMRNTMKTLLKFYQLSSMKLQEFKLRMFQDQLLTNNTPFNQNWLPKT